jgi:hypothetical protein
MNNVELCEIETILIGLFQAHLSSMIATVNQMKADLAVMMAAIGLRNVPQSAFAESDPTAGMRGRRYDYFEFFQRLMDSQSDRRKRRVGQPK